MNEWILIFYIGIGYGGGASSARFKTEKGCMEALSTLMKMSGWSASTSGFCAEDKK